MKKEQKVEAIDNLSKVLTDSVNFYIVDSSALTVIQTNNLRRMCFSKGITMQVVKNTLIQKALENANIKEDFSSVLKGASSIMISEDFSAPAKLIIEFRKTHAKPVLKAAYIQECLYVGDENLKSLLSIKSREQLIGDVIGMLQSPMNNVLSQLQSAGQKIVGVLKTIEEKAPKE
ncbi:MAG: 50S ribosomal protein L10 [Bacteroidetes bacterium]|nr:50S ribosomal protein L10 [Bacteroidota bacterium]